SIDDGETARIAEDRELLRQLPCVVETEARRKSKRHDPIFHNGKESERTAPLFDDMSSRNAQRLAQFFELRHANGNEKRAGGGDEDHSRQQNRNRPTTLWGAGVLTGAVPAEEEGRRGEAGAADELQCSRRMH